MPTEPRVKESVWGTGSNASPRALFGVRTGEAKSLPALKPVAKHEVKVQDGHVYVALNPKRVKIGGGRGRRR